MARLGQELDADEGVTGSVVGPQGEELRGQAVDGKEVRGASAHGEKVKLVSLVRHGSGAVLGQQKVAPKSHEIVCAPQLLQGRELKGTVTTFDAVHTHKPLAQQIIDQHGDYVMLVKKNQRMSRPTYFSPNRPNKNSPVQTFSGSSRPPGGIGSVQ